MYLDFLEQLSTMGRSSAEMKEMTERFKDLEPTEYDMMLRELIRAKDKQGVGNLMAISVANSVHLHPQLFIQSILLVDDKQIIFNAAEYQGEGIIEALLDYGYFWFQTAPSAAVIAFSIADDLMKKYGLVDEVMELNNNLQVIQSCVDEQLRPIYDFLLLKITMLRETSYGKYYRRRN
jgi:hypothetical protein